MTDTSVAVLAVSGHKQLHQQNTLLLKSLAARNPYVDCLNVLQAELLKRLRVGASASAAGSGGGCGGAEPVVWAAGEEARLQDALLITINGIANGMRNSG